MRGAAILLAALLNLAPSRAMSAGTIEIAPTTLDLKPGKAGLFYVTNSGVHPVVLQLQPMDWTQTNNSESVLVPSNTLIASPPLLRIAPGERQIVRLLADTGAQKREADYRLLVSELPDPRGASGAVRVLLQFSIPVFAASGSKPVDAQWSASERDGKLALVLANNGDAAFKITALSVAHDGGPPAPVPCGLVYVLPGARHVWTLPPDNVASLRVVARDARSGAPLDAEIPVQR
jgi:fimbrial chaperone protein